MIGCERYLPRRTGSEDSYIQSELRLGEQVLNEVEVVKVLGLLLQANLKWDVPG